MTAAAIEKPETPRSPFDGLLSKTSTLWVYALLVFLAALHLHLALTRSINWDEFWHYGLVETIARGESFQPLQTLFVRLFSWWLPQTPGNEIDHIVTARLFMLGFTGIAAFATYKVARRIAGHTGACLAVAAYLGGGFVLNHATSFRIDPMVAASLSSALAIAMHSRLRAGSLVAMGMLIALSAMFTIKFVLWLPAFAGVALWRWEEEGFEWTYVLRWVGAGLVALAGFAILFALHSWPLESSASVASPTSYAGGSAAKMFGILHSPYLPMTKEAVLFALPLAAAVIAAPFLIAKSDLPLAKRTAVFALWLPVLTPLFYHNSAPYFYVFILPPVAVAASVSLAFAAKRYGAGPIAGIIALFSLVVWFGGEAPVKEKQHTLLNAVHATFEEPVAYFDCCAMVGSFRQMNGFLTPWGLEGYRNSGVPRFKQAMEQGPVPLLLDNEQMFAPLFSGAANDAFHPKDAQALRSNYRRFWGDIFIAGRNLAPGETIAWNVLVPGTYTVSDAMVIDGRQVAAGAQVELSRGLIEIRNNSSEPANLTWGRDTRVPDAPPVQDYWGGF